MIAPIYAASLETWLNRVLGFAARCEVVALATVSYPAAEP